MGDHQRIHPVTHDVEAHPQTPTAPLVQPGTAKSDEKTHPGPTAAAYPAYPPFQRTIPVAYSRPPKRRRRSCLCRCCCWTLSLITLLLLIIAIATGIIYLVFRPKLPDYSIDKMQITLTTPNSLEATFDVTITATNPNKKIGIYYEEGSVINVLYTDTKLCEGSLPKFYQGHRNTTVLDLVLVGQTEDATGLITMIQQQQQQNGNIPLKLNVNQPVRIKLGALKLFKVKFRVRCDVVVDSVAANNQITIQKSSCKFKLRL